MTRGGRRGRPKAAMNTRASPVTNKASQLAHEHPEVSNQEESNGIAPNQSQVQDENISSLILTNSGPTQLTSSYASMVDLNKGNSLSFIPTPVINGSKLAKLEKDDMNPEIAY